MMTTLDDSDKDTTDVEIAAFSALVRSSSGGYNDNDNDNDNDNSSLVSLDDERLGLLLHGEEENDIRVIDIGDNAHGKGKEVHVGSADIVLAEDKGRSGDDNDDDTLFDSPNCRGYFRFLLGRIKSNPTLSIATMFMGILTTYLWTNEGYQNFGIRIRHNNNNANNKNSLGGEKNKGRKKSTSSRPISFPAFPAKPLLGISIRKKQHFIIESESPMDIEPPYSPDDFIYETKSRKTRTLTYWEEIVEAIELSSSYNEGGSSSSNDNTTIVALWENISNWGPCFPRPLHELRLLRSSMAQSSIPLNWTDIVQANSHQILNEESIVYPTYKKSHHVQPMEESLGGLCRPGFIIIGQGKCGTSSLYHYLTGHPRILPAKEKQIHYFRYHKSKPLAWYYSHFPTIETFLGNGALMSGEASPGYMPYPNVVESLTKVLSPNWRPSSDSGDDNNDNGHGVKVWKEKIRSLPKIIAIVRDPINRAQSSYKYNYIEPALKKLKNGRGLTASGQRIPGGKTERYYRQHFLFSFEELVYAELAMLRECLEYGGRGEQWTTKRFGRKSDMFFYEPIQRRKYNNNNTVLALDAPPLIHLDEACYIETESKSVPRAQWVELAKEHPNKTLALPNLHLIQSIVGRGIYSYPLEWWYLVFEEDSIHVVCTEDMANIPNSVMDNVTSFLGLPDYDYTNVTSIGRYNVGGHRGYDTITKKLQDDDDNDDSLATSVEEKEEELPLPHVDDGDLLAISDALRNELLHFYQLYNERLFHLIDKRCPWE